MSVDVTAAVVGGLACGVAGLGVPTLISRIPEPSSAGPDDPPQYAPIAARPGLAWRAALLSVVAGLLVGGSVGLEWPLLYLLPLVPVGVALAIVDLHTHLLPTKVIWPTLGGVAVLALVAGVLDGDLGAFVRAVVGGVVVLVIFHALWWVYPAGMGYGDVRLAALLGFALGYLGWAELVVGIYGSFLVFAVLGLLRAGVRRDRDALSTPLPFGPFLLAGAVAGIVLGDPIWSSLVTG